MIPLETIDHIFSFLSTDLDSLESCCIADPVVLAPIAERYFYRKITLKNYDKMHVMQKRILQYTCPEIKEILSTNPLIANHVRILNIWVSLLRSDIRHFIDAIISILPIFTRVNCLSLSGIGGPSIMSTDFIAALNRYMLLPSLMEVEFCFDIPFHLFNNWKNIKSLTFGGLDFAVARLHSKPVLDTTNLQLESLSISNSIRTSNFPTSCALWAKSHVRYLRSLSFYSRFDQSLLGLFEICSASLTNLELDFGDDFQTKYNRGVVLPPSSGVPFNLFSLPHLQELTLHPNITFFPNLPAQNYCSSLPAIMRLVKTSPPLKRLVLVFEFSGFIPSTLPKIDFSSMTIFANSSFTFDRMEIQMIQGRKYVPAATVLSYFMGNEELMRLHRQDVLFIPEP